MPMTERFLIIIYKNGEVAYKIDVSENIDNENEFQAIQAGMKALCDKVHTQVLSVLDHMTFS